MSEETNFVIKLIIVAIVFVYFLGWIISEGDKCFERNRQKNIQEINECLDKTSDRDWCFNKFLK